jgi:heat-inducible transcriptional repressor
MKRKDYILKLIVQHFIKTAQPVGSKTLIEEYDLQYSSATIRAEMNALEQEGLLEKTHTSSGRVPSSQGYQYYISNLRDSNINEEIKHRIQTVLDQKIASIDEIIKESCEILAHMTNLASVVLGPDSKQEKLVSIQIIPLSNKSATAVFVTDQGYVENKTFVINDESSIDDVKECIKLLNDRLVGTPVSELVEKMESIKPLLSDYIIDHDVVYQALLQTFLRFANDRLETYGKSELLKQPEFANDADKLKKIIDLLDNPTQIKQYVKDKKGDGIIVKIGDSESNDDVSVVSANISIDGVKEGTISILGPKRMDYDQVLSTLEYVVAAISNHFDSKKGVKHDGKEGKQKGK